MATNTTCSLVITCQAPGLFIV